MLQIGAMKKPDKGIELVNASSYVLGLEAKARLRQLPVKALAFAARTGAWLCLISRMPDFKSAFAQLFTGLSSRAFVPWTVFRRNQEYGACARPEPMGNLGVRQDVRVNHARFHHAAKGV